MMKLNIIGLMRLHSEIGDFNLVVVENENGERSLRSCVLEVLPKVDPGAEYPKESEVISWGYEVDISRLEGLISKAKAQK